MEKYTKTAFKRDSSLAKRLLKVVGSSMVCLDDFRVIFPERYINQELAFMGTVVKVVNIFAIIDSNNNYCVPIAPIYIELIPSNIVDVEVDGVSYKCLIFNKGDIFTGNTSLIKTGDFLYNLFDEFYIRGKIPWYIDYNDLTDILLESSKFCNSAIGDNPLAYEILAGVIGRRLGNREVKYRHIIKDNKDKDPIEYVGLSNIYYSYDNTASKLVGGYYGAGVTAAIVSQEKEPTIVANLLRA